MKLLGRDTGELRLPMTPLDAAGEASLRKTLERFGCCDHDSDEASRCVGDDMMRVLVLCEYPSLNGGEHSLLEVGPVSGSRNASSVIFAAPPTGPLADGAATRGADTHRVVCTNAKATAAAIAGTARAVWPS